MSEIKYQTTEQVRESLTEEELAALVKALPTYSAGPVTLATMECEEITAEMILAWAGMVRAMQQVYPDAKVTGQKITRERTQAELEFATLANEASRRYYAEKEAEAKASK